MTKLVKAIHQIFLTLPGDEGEFRETPEGKTVIARQAKTTTIQPGQLFVPLTDETLAELLGLDAVVEPSDAEVALWEATEGKKTVAAAPAPAPAPAPATSGKPPKAAATDDMIG